MPVPAPGERMRAPIGFPAGAGGAFRMAATSVWSAASDASRAAMRAASPEPEPEPGPGPGHAAKFPP